MKNGQLWMENTETSYSATAAYATGCNNTMGTISATSSNNSGTFTASANTGYKFDNIIKLRDYRTHANLDPRFF
jgi:hypothetical protein